VSTKEGNVGHVCMTACSLGEKGGPGKTTTTVEAIFQTKTLHEKIHKTKPKILAIDLDGQGTLTQTLTGVKAHPTNACDLLADKKGFVKLEDVITKASGEPWDGVSVLPCTRDINLIGEHWAVHNFSREEKACQLRKKLEKAYVFFDYIFIDTPPKYDSVTLSALVASDVVIVNLRANSDGLRGLDAMIGWIDVAKTFNKSLEVGPHIVCKYQDNITEAQKQKYKEIKEPSFYIKEFKKRLPNVKFHLIKDVGESLHDHARQNLVPFSFLSPQIQYSVTYRNAFRTLIKERV
jgi:chromosome partitioning protein